MNESTPARSNSLRKWAIRASVCLILAVIGIMILATRPSALQRAVEQAGGTFEQEVEQRSPVDLAIGLLTRQPPYRLTRIRLENQHVDDHWLKKHSHKLAELPHLVLDMNNTKITHEGLHELSNFANLKWLSLVGTPLEPRALDVISTLPNLSTVDISCTGIAGGEFTRLKSAPQLVAIVIDRDQATDDGLAALTQVPGLVILTIFDATDETVFNLQQTALPKVSQLMLIGKGVTAESVEALAKFTELKMLSLYETSLNDPEQIRLLKNSLPDCEVSVYSKEELEGIGVDFH